MWGLYGFRQKLSMGPLWVRTKMDHGASMDSIWAKWAVGPLWDRQTWRARRYLLSKK